MNTKEFVERLKQLFPDGDYDYSKTAFNGWNENSTIHCNKHGIDITKKANSFINGCGCHLCKRSGHKYSEEEWIVLAKTCRPEYDYSHSRYVNKSTKVDVYCKEKDKDGVEHGFFSVYPNELLSSEADCPKCRKEKHRKEKENELLIAMREIYKDYDYDISEVTYKDTHTPVKVFCNIHNTAFYPIPCNILSKHTICKKCADDRTRENRRAKLDEIIRRATEIHDSCIDFSYCQRPKNWEDKLKLFCHKKFEDGTEHGIFYKSPHALINSKQGCPICSRIQSGLNRRSSQFSFIESVTSKHIGKNYDFSSTKYIKSKEYVSVFCNEKDKYGNVHGEFNIMACNLKQGYGCPKCNTSHLEQEIRAALIEHNIDFEWHYGNDWLGRQSLDFYVPSKNIGIECQGSQHFIPDFLRTRGVKDCEIRLKLNQIRDERKKKLCKENGLKLIYFLDKQFEKYMQPDDAYFTDKDEMVEYIKKL